MKGCLTGKLTKLAESAVVQASQRGGKNLIEKNPCSTRSTAKSDKSVKVLNFSKKKDECRKHQGSLERESTGENVHFDKAVGNFY